MQNTQLQYNQSNELVNPTTYSDPVNEDNLKQFLKTHTQYCDSMAANQHLEKAKAWPVHQELRRILMIDFKKLIDMWGRKNPSYDMTIHTDCCQKTYFLYFFTCQLFY